MVGVSGVRSGGTGIPLLCRLATGALSLAIVAVREVALGLVILLLHTTEQQRSKKESAGCSKEPSV